jgi:hypothetical protein
MTLEIVHAIKNVLPETCPSCGTLTGLGPKLAEELKRVSQKFMEKASDSA